MTNRGFGSFVGSIKDSVEDIKDSIEDNLKIDIDGIKEAGGECHNAAREASSICDTTIPKAKQLVDFGMDMRTALDNFGDGVDFSDFSALGNIISGDKMKFAMGLASEMDDLALACTAASVRMIDAMDVGIETLPDILEKGLDSRMDNAKEKGSKDGDPELPDLEPDIRALETAAESVRDANPSSAIESLKTAFDGITEKGQLSGELFGTIHDFAEDVAGVSEAIRDLSFGKIASEVKDLVKGIWRCLRLSDLIRSFANAVEQLILVIMKVIGALQEKFNSFNFDLFGCCGGDIEETLKSFGMENMCGSKTSSEAVQG